MFDLQRIALKHFKSQATDKEKIFSNIYWIKNKYPKYIKNSYNLMIKKGSKYINSYIEANKNLHH